MGAGINQSSGVGMYLLSHMFKRFVQKGTLIVIDPKGKRHEFRGTEGPSATIQINDPGLPLKIFRNPELSIGEGYMDETLTMVDCTLAEFMALFSVNRSSISSYPLMGVIKRLSMLMRKFLSAISMGMTK